MSTGQLVACLLGEFVAGVIVGVSAGPAIRATVRAFVWGRAS